MIKNTYFTESEEIEEIQLDLNLNSIVTSSQKLLPTKEKQFFLDSNDFLIKFNHKLLLKLQNKRNKPKTIFFLICSFYGLSYFWAVLGITALLLKLFHVSIILLITGESSLEVIVPLKRYFRRKRPYETYNDLNGVTKPKDTSFPSGHVYCATVNSFALVFCFGAVIFIPMAFILVSLVGYSRLYFGVHYLSDVFMGLFLGVIVAIVVMLFFPFIMIAHNVSLSL